MSWQLAAFGILGLALAAGFAWYERARPDARIVALVATLAAFAALGRIAFAAVPNVKPTSDIVLISGYALGAGPGFVVGALAGLTSNFFFGQGPWTPWQMAAWGATGVLGAWLALLTGRRIGRWPLALVCAVAGFAFTAVQDLGDWVTYSDHDLRSLGVYVGKGLGFDGVHAAGCLLFALAFGLALVRSVGRFAQRIQVRWEAVAGILLLGAWLASQPGLGAGRALANATPTTYLRAAQNADGGFGPAPGQGSAGLYSGWAALGLEAQGINPSLVVSHGHSLLSYIETRGGGASDPGSRERTILALSAAGAPAGAQLAALARDVGANGSISNQSNLTAFGILSLRSAGVAPRRTTLRWLARQQDADGGFNYGTAGGQSDVDDTGAVLEALGRGAGSASARAVRFIESQQDRDGGFPSAPGSGSNAQSTAWAVQGLLAAGAGAPAVDRAVAYIQSLIAPDGHIRYARGADQTPVWVTAEAVMALARKPLPLSPVPARAATPRGPARPARRAAKRREIRHTPRPQPVAHASPITDGLASYVAVAEVLALAPIGIS